MAVAVKTGMVMRATEMNLSFYHSTPRMCRCCHLNKTGVLANMQAAPANRTEINCECMWRKAQSKDGKTLNWVAIPCDRCVRMFHRLFEENGRVRMIDVYGNKYNMAAAPVEVREDN